MTVVVVGSGIAGLTTALRLARLCGPDAVTLVTKGELDESNTFYAQGGIAAALASGDSPAAHAADTIAAGVGLNDAEAVRTVCTEGPQRVRELIERWQVPFDRDASGQLARGLEAAHSQPRVWHAGGDATGKAIVLALGAGVRRAGVQVREHTIVEEIILAGGAVAGVRLSGGVTLDATEVVLATGGLGAVFASTTNPAGATGDGVAIAWRAGAMVRDLEFVQFHPTALAVPEHFLISEAVRGEGAVLRDASGARFMADLHPLAELAPRDVVARGIYRAMAAQGGTPVFLDATALGGASALAARFPTIDAHVRAAGFNWANEPIPVTPAAHYAMGGVAADLNGHTSIAGLYAVGEVASSGLHGANRLASNSLVEGLVFGARAADDIARRHAATGDTTWARDADERWARPADASATASRHVSAGEPEKATGVDVDVDVDVASRRAEVGAVMWQYVGVERSAGSLSVATARLASIASALPEASSSVEDVELRNLVTVAQLITAFAVAREESRGAHFRTDFVGLGGDARHQTAFRQVQSQAAPARRDSFIASPEADSENTCLLSR